MNNIKVLCLLSVLFFLFSSAIFSQHGDPQNRRVGTLNSNQIKTIFMNTGVIAQPGTEGPRFSWIHPSNGYVGDMSIVLGLQLPIKDYWRGEIPPDGTPDTIYSVIITPVDRPGGGENNNNFEPLPGYFNPNLNEIGRGVAVSTDLESWPTLWPDHPEYGTGFWNGLYGPDNYVGDQEAYFVMDDFYDRENNILNHFYPDTNDTAITGHGIEVKVRYVELNNPKYQDVLFKIYDIKNKSNHNYPKVVFGNLIGTYLGIESPEWNDDVSLYYPKDNLIVSSDFNNFINPSANPNWQGRVGMFGETFLHSPTGNEIASYQYFVPAGNISMADDLDMWYRMLPGFYQYPSSVFYQDSIPYPLRGEDGDYMWGGNYFPLNSMETKRIVTASVFGYNKSDILLKMKYAEALYNSNFDTSAVKNSITLTSLSYHKIVTGNETITWNSINSNGSVDILYSPDYGNTWETIANNIPNNGSYTWNSTLVEDGSFAKIVICIKNEEGYTYAIDESEYFTVNNSENGKPFVKIFNDELYPGYTISDETYNFNLLLGDPENSPLLLKVWYSLNSDSIFYNSQNINILSDTSIQSIPIGLKHIPNSNKLRIKFEISDEVNFYSDVTLEFAKQNNRQILGSQNFEWIRHYAEVPVAVNIIDSTQYRGQEYIITFNDSIPNEPKTFSVFNKTLNEYSVFQEPIYPGNESIIFDGMALYTEDILTDLDPILSGWNNPDPENLNYVIDQFYNQQYKAYRYPFDYKIVFSFTFDDSSNYLDQIFGTIAPPVNPNLNFKIYQKTEANWERIQFAFSDQTRIDTLSNGDIVFLSNESGDKLSWRVKFIGEQSSNIPWGGDTLFIYTKKGLSVFDTIRVHGLTVDVENTPNIPYNFSLSQNYPNPFNPNTRIQYQVSRIAQVTLKLYDILGREIMTLVNEEKPAGKYEVDLNASNLASGVYFYQIKAGDFVQSKKMILIK